MKSNALFRLLIDHPESGSRLGREPGYWRPRIQDR
jgi:hypothetical protein